MNNKHVINDPLKATQKESTLHLLSLAFTVVINYKIVYSTSYYLDNYTDEEAMVMQFLNDMRSYASRIIKKNKIEELPLHYQFKEVPILGFNSAKFDMNLLVKYLCTGEYKIVSTLGKSSYYKCLKVKTSVLGKEKVNSEGEITQNKHEITLRFVDAMIYAPGCILDQFTQDYTEKKDVKREKGFFPYEAITTDNHKDYLSKQNLLNKKTSIHH
jgi:hypothetical protein